MGHLNTVKYFCLNYPPAPNAIDQTSGLFAVKRIRKSTKTVKYRRYRQLQSVNSITCAEPPSPTGLVLIICA